MICIIKKCDKTVKSKSMCAMHLQVFYSGKDLGNHINRQPQEIITKGDKAFITLYDKYGNEKDKAVIDEDDVDRVSKHKWYSSRKYVITRLAPTNKFIRLHRYVLGCEDSSRPFVDHINRNPLDNRKENLRKVDYSQSMFNTKSNKQFKGVYFEDSVTGTLKNKWRVKIQAYGKTHNVGRFNTEEEAAWMYDQWALVLHGEHATLNFEYI